MLIYISSKLDCRLQKRENYVINGIQFHVNDILYLLDPKESYMTNM